MNNIKYFNVFYGCLRREILRYLKDPEQTIFSVLVSKLLFFTVLYYLTMNKESLMFIIPGILLLINSEAISSNIKMIIFLGKIENTIYYQLSSPISRLHLYLIYGISSILRGIIISLLFLIIAKYLFLISFKINIIFILSFLLLDIFLVNVSIVISLFSNNWNTIGAIENYILYPFTYLSGGFFSININLNTILLYFIKINPLYHFIIIFQKSQELSFKECLINSSFFYSGSFSIISTVICLYFFKSGIKLLK